MGPDIQCSRCPTCRITSIATFNRSFTACSGRLLQSKNVKECVAWQKDRSYKKAWRNLKSCSINSAETRDFLANSSRSYPSEKPNGRKNCGNVPCRRKARPVNDRQHLSRIEKRLRIARRSSLSRLLIELQEAPDLLATTPEGHFAVVECTTGPLTTDNKLPRLIARSEIIRARLAASNNLHLRVLPVIVTSKRLVEVRADIEQAERLGVLIVTAELLEATLSRTLVLSNADEIFLEGERTVASALAKYETRSVMPSNAGNR